MSIIEFATNLSAVNLLNISSFLHYRRYAIALLLAIQILLAFFAFKKVLTGPDWYSLANGWDGGKNYFTYNEYVHQQSDSNLLLFTQMNYPYGEYIFYTDNTPIVALVVKVLNKVAPSIGKYSIGIFNWGLIAQILICSILAYVFLSYFIKDYPWVAIIAAIAFSWCNPQLVRIIIGHHNLSFGMFFVLELIILRKLYLNRTSIVPLLKWAALLFATIVLAAFMHLYYLLLLSVPALIFLSVLAMIYLIKEKRLLYKFLLVGCGSVVLAVCVVYGGIRLTDKYFNERKQSVTDFGYDKFATTIDALFAPYDFVNKLQPPFRYCREEILDESTAFIGNATTYGLLLLLFYFLYNTIYTKGYFKRSLKYLVDNSYITASVIVIVMSYSIALGFTVRSCFIDKPLTNYLNPLWYISDFAGLVTHFRSMGRFNWMGYWLLNFFTIIAVAQVLRKHKIIRAEFVLGVLSLVMVFETLHFVNRLRKIEHVNTFSKKYLDNNFADMPEIEFSSYQALLPLPLYLVGSENKEITIDDNPDWSNFTYQISSYSKLPLMATKLSRSSVEQTESFVKLVEDKKVQARMFKLMNEKPVLVIYSRQHTENPMGGLNPRTEAVVKGGESLIAAMHMDTLFEHKGLLYLSWNVKEHH